MSPPSALLLRTAAVLTGLAACAPALPADLMSLRLEDLMQIGVVGASKYEQAQGEVAAAVSVITRQEIRAHGWRTLDQALESLPGFATSYDRQYVYPALRGLGIPGDYATRVLVTVNGNRMNDPVYDQGPFGRMLPVDLDLVERIEFIPGPGGAVYGQNAMFGVINLVTREAADVDGFEVAVSGQEPQGLRDARLTWGGRSSGGTSALLSVSSLHSRGEDRWYDFGVAGVAGVARDLDWERDHEVFARLGHGAWTLDLVHGERNKGDPTANFATDPLSPGKYVRDEYRTAQLAWQEAVADGLRLDVRAFAGRYGADAEGRSGGAHFGTRSAAGWYGAEIRLVSTRLARHTVMLGAEGQVESQRDQAFIDYSTGAGSFALPADGHRVGAYVQDEWQIAGGLSSTAGLRVDDSDRGDATVSPRLALLWQATPSLSLKALYGRAHRSPNAFERDYTDGFARTSNPDLASERVDTAELVADLRVGSDLALRASVYQWTLHDIVTLGTDPVSGLAQYQSGAEIEALGAELSADRTWSGGARLRASLSLQDADGAGGRRLPNSPQWLGRVSFMQPLPWKALQLAAVWRYGSERRTLGGDLLGGWGVLDATLTAEGWLRGLDLTLAATNLLDRDYAHPATATNWQDALDQDGRSVLLRIGYRF